MNMPVTTENAPPLAEETARVEELLARSKLEVGEIVAAEMVATLADLKERLQHSDSVDDAVKSARLLMDLHGGWSKKDKGDANDNLPVFNIVINGGGVSVEHVPSDPPLVEEVDKGVPDWVMETITSKFASDVAINRDVASA